MLQILNIAVAWIFCGYNLELVGNVSSFIAAENNGGELLCLIDVLKIPEDHTTVSKVQKGRRLLR